MSTVTLFTPDMTKLALPVITNTVPAGFPSPAEEYLGDTLDLNAYVIKNPASTFFARVDGDSMIEAGIMPDDLVVVDRGLEAKHGDVVIAVVNGDMTIKRLSTRMGLRLVPENKNYSEIPITGSSELSIWGVVTFRIGKV